jgi:colanic acid/amylovoran biosynthesis glycosyltransferase
VEIIFSLKKYMKVAFFLHEFPVKSETFVLNELFYLQESGIKGIIISEKKDSECFHPKIKKILYKHIVINKFILSFKYFTSIFRSHTYWVIKNPAGYIQSLKYLFSVISKENLRIFLQALPIAKTLENKKIDILYCHESDSASFYMFICKYLLKKPAGIIFHTYYLFYKNKYLIKKLTAADFIIFQSQYSKRYALKKVKKNKLKLKILKKVKVISSVGIDMSFFIPQKNKMWSSNQIKIISIGRLEEAKGFEYLIKAIYLLKKKSYSINCNIIGYGSLKNKLEKLVRKLDLKNNVFFLGKIGHNKKLIKHLSKADLFILPSIIDKNGVRDMQANVIKEAMSMGLLVLTTKLGGIDEVIDENINGFLFPEKNLQKLAKTIEKTFLLNKKQKKIISKEAIKKIKNKYESRSINKELVELFTKSTHQ